MINRDSEYYAIVPSGEEQAWSQVPENGKKWIIRNVEAAAPNCSDGWVAIIWDYDGSNPEVLFVAYDSAEKDLTKSIVGDGAKKLAIVLHNEGLSELVMGGKYKAREL